MKLKKRRFQSLKTRYLLFPNHIRSFFEFGWDTINFRNSVKNQVCFLISDTYIYEILQKYIIFLELFNKIKLYNVLRIPEYSSSEFAIIL